MNKSEILAEVREIAAVMGVRGLRPGHVSDGLKYRSLQLGLKAGLPFKPWREFIRHEIKLGTGLYNGETCKVRVLAATVRDEPGELVQRIQECLNVISWESVHPEWAPEDAEQMLVKAAEMLPGLCDRLEALEAAPDLPGPTGDNVAILSEMFAVKAFDEATAISRPEMLRRLNWDSEGKRMFDWLKKFGWVESCGRGYFFTEAGKKRVETLL